MTHPLFVSGPHGCGKTTLLRTLLAQHEGFIENDFDIDFMKEFPGIKKLNDFEKCLLRLYHRSYLIDYARIMAQEHKNHVVITSRGIYDSEAYAKCYRDLEWISSEEYARLDFIVRRREYTPYTIVVNPPVPVVWERLMGRRSTGARKERDTVFRAEDTLEFLTLMHRYFSEMWDRDHVLYLEDNSAVDVERITAWAETIAEGEYHDVS